MKVYTVEEIVDLGNHVIHVFAKKDKAESVAYELNKEMQSKFVPTRTYFEVWEYEVEE